MEDQVKKLHAALGKISKGGSKSEELKAWVRTVVEPEGKFIETLVKYTLDQWIAKQDSSVIKQYLQIFR